MYEIRDSLTHEAVDYADTYVGAINLATSLTKRTKRQHYVPVGVAKLLTLA